MKLIRNSISSVLYHGSRYMGTRSLKNRILCYHRVSDEVDNYITVSTKKFREQMGYLAKEGYKTISLQELIEGKCDEQSIVITFDDGYRDNYEQAFPTMNEYGFAGTIFCIANEMGKDDYLTLKHIREMRKSNFEFGSHTLSHPKLTQLSANQKWDEIIGSKKALEELFEHEVKYFCYPFGYQDQETRDLVKQAGYSAACSNAPGTNDKIDIYRLRRTEIAAHDSLRDFEKKCVGAYDLMHQLLHTMRGRP